MMSFPIHAFFLNLPLVLGLLFALPAQSQELTLVPGSAQVAFRIKNAGFWVDGQLEGLQVAGTFRPDQPEKSRLQASVEAASIQTGINARDEHLKQEKYLHVAQYPRMRIESRRIAGKGSDWTLEGDLTIKGTTQPIRIPFDLIPSERGYTLKGSFSINRLDFDVGGKSLLLGNTVEVDIQCTLAN